MRIPENHCMPLPKALKMRAIKHTMALITDSTGCTKCAPAQMPWHLRHLNPALLNRQGMSTHPKMENGSELCHWKGQLVIGLRANPVRPRKPPQIGAKLGFSFSRQRECHGWLAGWARAAFPGVRALHTGMTFVLRWKTSGSAVNCTERGHTCTHT